MATHVKRSQRTKATFLDLLRMTECGRLASVPDRIPPAFIHTVDVNMWLSAPRG